jgi:hypothetical protein
MCSQERSRFYERQLGVEKSQKGVSHPPVTFPHGQVKSESDMFAAGFRVEYLSGKLLDWTVESGETALLV